MLAFLFDAIRECEIPLTLFNLYISWNFQGCFIIQLSICVYFFRNSLFIITHSVLFVNNFLKLFLKLIRFYFSLLSCSATCYILPCLFPYVNNFFIFFYYLFSLTLMRYKYTIFLSNCILALKFLFLYFPLFQNLII